MFGWFKKLKQKSEFKIEYYPITKIYVCLYKGIYLKKDPNTGIIRKLCSNLLCFATQFKQYEEACDFIQEFKQQHLKQNIEIYDID